MTTNTENALIELVRRIAIDRVKELESRRIHECDPPLEAPIKFSLKRLDAALDEEFLERRKTDAEHKQAELKYHLQEDLLSIFSAAGSPGQRASTVVEMLLSQYDIVKKPD